jgi:cell division protein FtsL
VVLIVVATLLCTAVAIIRVWTRLRAIEYGYKISQASRRHSELVEQNRRLRVEVTLLKSPARIARIAQEELGLQHPQPDQIRRLSVEQVQRLVASKGDQATVAAIFEGSDPTAQVAGESFDREESPEDIAAGPVTTPAPTVPAASAPVAPVVTAPPAATETKEDIVARARALMEKAKNLPSAAPAAAPAPAPAPTPAPAPKPAPAPAVSDLVKDPPPTPPPPPAPAATSGAEQDFLKQFEM